MKEILTEEQNKIQQNSCSIEISFAVYFLQFFKSLINEYNNQNLIVPCWIYLTQWFLMMFNTFYIFVEFTYIPWNSILCEHDSQSNVVIPENAIPLYRTQYPPYVPPWKEMVKPEPVPFRKLEM